MKYLKRILGFTIFVFSFIGLISILSSSLVVNAQEGTVELQNGVSCVPNFGTCDPGYKNLFQEIGKSITTHGGFNATGLREYLKSGGLDDRSINNQCVREGVNSLITLYQQGGGATLEKVPGTCSGNNRPAQAANSGDFPIITNEIPWGCCPSDAEYKFLFSPNNNAPSMCCMVVSGMPEATRIVNQRCGYSDGGGYKEVPYNELQDQTKKYQINESEIGRETLGTINAVNTEAAAVCPDNYPCMDVGGKIVASDSIRENTTLACNKCYQNNEPIRIVDGQTIYCDGAKAAEANGNSNTEVTSSTETIGGSAIATEACLQNGDINSDNYKACGQCIERGGIWIAIGCVDTSPLGIITGLIRISYGIMGGVALYQLIKVGIYYQMGQQDKIEEARKQIIATLTGIAVLTFSVLILRIIGVNILDILPAGSI